MEKLLRLIFSPRWWKIQMESFLFWQEEIYVESWRENFFPFLPSWNHVQSLHNPRKQARRELSFRFRRKKLICQNIIAISSGPRWKRQSVKRSKAVIALEIFWLKHGSSNLRVLRPSLSSFVSGDILWKVCSLIHHRPLIIDNHDQGYPLRELNQIFMHKWCHMIPICLLW